MLSRQERKERRRALMLRQIGWTRYKVNPSLSVALMDQSNRHTPMGKALKQWRAAYPRTYDTILQRLEEPQR